MLLVLVMAVVMSCKITLPVEIRRVRIYLVGATDPLTEKALFCRRWELWFSTGQHLMVASFTGGGVRCIKYIGVPVEYPIGLVVLLACMGVLMLARTQNERRQRKGKDH